MNVKGKIVKYPVYVREEPYTVEMYEPQHFATVEFYSLSGNLEYTIRLDVSKYNCDYVRIIKEARESFIKSLEEIDAYKREVNLCMAPLEAWDGH